MNGSITEKPCFKRYSGSYPTDPHRAEDRRRLAENIECRLLNSEKVPVAFPHCTDVLLAQVTEKPRDEINNYFEEYFIYRQHRIIEGVPPVSADLMNCTGTWFPSDYNDCTILNADSEHAIQDAPGASARDAISSKDLQRWPSPHCLSPSCVTLEGTRNISRGTLDDQVKVPVRIKRLFIGDLVWLFYFERMGIFKILGAILDDYATKGKHPLPNGDIRAVVMESMIRSTKSGLSSAVRERDSTYRRSLGWTSDTGRKLGSDALVNTAFNNLFHKFLQSALEYYKDKRLATAIQATTTPRTSVATLITIGDTIEILKKSFIPFRYGRNYSNTLSGIVWVVAGLDLIKRLRAELGIPENYKEPFQYIQAAYDLLVMGRPVTPSEADRYTLHKECARDGRDILLDIEVLDSSAPAFGEPGGELEIWLDRIEDRVEGYRTAYRSLTGIDLGVPGSVKVEQQV
jgi:hypothetical protein